MPGSVTSSVNSSESEQGSVPQSAASGQSNRSVYLHATAVADIPPSQTRNAAGDANNLKNSKKISRSISLLAPFKSKQPPKEKEITYDSAGNIVPPNTAGGGGVGKPPRPPPAPIVRRAPLPAQPNNMMMTKERKFASSSDLLRDDPSSSLEDRGLGGEDGKSSKVSRSVSMPKDTRLAGWFKKRKRV